MRAPYVNQPELLTPIGRWIADRLPHIESASPSWSTVPGSRVFRVYGIKPLRRVAIIDFTSARFYRNKPKWTRLRLFGVTVFEHNRQYSGLPR